MEENKGEVTQPSPHPSLKNIKIMRSLLFLDFKRSSFPVGFLAGLKESQTKQRQGDNVFVIYPQIDGKGTATGGLFKADDSPAGHMLLPCYVQLGKLDKL